MNVTPGTSIISTDGVSGRILPTEDNDAVLIQLEDGRQMRVPSSLLRSWEDGHFYLPVNISELDQEQTASAPLQEASRPATMEHLLTVPVVAEELQVGKRTIETGRARITKRVQEREEIIDEPLIREEVAVERIPINRPWEGPPPPVRYEGDRMIIPLLAEVLVIEKKLVLKEELHVWRVQKAVHEPQHVTLRSEEVSVERVNPSPEITPVTDASHAE